MAYLEDQKEDYLIMYGGITVAPLREGKITVTISFPIANKIEVENRYLISGNLLFSHWQDWKTGCSKP